MFGSYKATAASRILRESVHACCGGGERNQLLARRLQQCRPKTMVNAYPLHQDPDPQEEARRRDPTEFPDPVFRLKVLLTEDRAREDEHWTRQLPRLLEPLGVQAQIASTAKEALDAADRTPFHAAVVDLYTPLAPGKSASGDAGGLWLLQVMHRRVHRPPVVMVNSQATSRHTVRLLNDALRLGAFSVVNRPEHVDRLLHVIARLLQRRHDGRWPEPPTPSS